MHQLIEAILDRFRTDSRLYDACDGNFTFDRAKQEDLDNYITFHIISNVPDEVFDYTRRMEVTRIQFSLFSKSSSAAQINEMFSALTKCYDRAMLVFRAGDYETIMMSREMGYLFKTTDNYWQYVCDFIVQIQPVTTTTSP